MRVYDGSVKVGESQSARMKEWGMSDQGGVRVMANLLPTTLTSSPHMPTLPPLAHHYIVLQIDICFAIDQQLHGVFMSITGCNYEPCVTILHTKEASADDSVRACHVRMTVLGWWGS